MTPTQRTLAKLRKDGWHAAKVEHWNSFARQTIDLFGGDVLAAMPGHPLLLVQCTSASNIVSRLTKSVRSKSVAAWLATGHATFEVWGWSKKGPRGKRKTWQLTVRLVTPEDMEV